jgi:recombination protein RecT
MGTEAKPEGEKLGVALARWEPMIAPMLPKGVTAERMLQAALLVATIDPTGIVAKCTPKSLALSVARIAQWGLEPGVTAHLVPFFDKKKGCYEAQAIPDYKGLIQLMRECGSRIDAQVVRAGDEFHYEMGLTPILRHIPAAKAGEIVAAYCIVRRKGEEPTFEVMTADQINAIRNKLSKQWSGEKVPLLPEWYARKTVIRRASKYVPMYGDHGAKLRMALTQDAEYEEIPDAEITPITGDVKPIELPRRAPTHQPLDLSAMTEEIGTVETGSVDIMKAFEKEPEYEF